MYFSQIQIESIYLNAKKILSEIGVSVPREDMRDKLEQKGFRVSGKRIYIEKQRTDEQMKQYSPPEKSPHSDTISYSLSAYPHTYQNADGKYEPITVRSNIAAAQLIARVKADYPNLYASAPGHPVDVPDYQQFFYQTVHTLKYCPDSYGAEAMNTRIAPYIFELGDLMGMPVRGGTVYVASPLTIAGDSLDIVMLMQSRLECVNVTCMPVLGANTPMNLVAAYSQSLAETLGGAIVIQEATGVKSNFYAQIFPMDFRAMTMSFGTPEQLVCEWMNAEVNARLIGGEPDIHATDIHVMPHKAGVQALTEKCMLAAAGAMRGARHFHTLGTLSMDEVFSPVQFFMDLDMLQSIQKIIKGLPNDDFNGDIIEIVKSGLEDSYIGSDLTLDNMNRYIHYPSLMTRQSYNALIEGKNADMYENARVLAYEYINKPQIWQIDEAREREIDKITKKI